ncbi:hypothetical protein A3Q56_04211 [Intoshia linei]|uniref:RING-type domain-containing protein n=1 Tax=Intoshia linei TaxID=1819745 RepID=A0A177B1B3_9BILA|nr:hypothetical protein A3Q56_04211 [Intoshia linei]
MVDIMIMTSATEYYEIFIENYLNVDKIANTSIDTLVQMGISSKVANNLINHVKENYTKDVNVELENPKLSETNQLNLKNLPISTYEAEEECVICMEKMCDVIFLMCGHICTCSICTNRVEICPLCRSNIEKRMKKY